MKWSTLLASLVITILLAQPSAALSQELGPLATDTWDVVKSVPAESELEVLMKNGQKVRGRLLNVSDTAIRVARKDEIADLHKERILKVYRLLPKSNEFRRLTSGVGASVGGGVGLAIGISTNRRPTNRGVSAAIILIPLSTALGAIGGYFIGSRLKSRMLIYNSK
jgi:hypothetical protein